MAKHVLIVGQASPLPDPAPEVVEAAAAAVLPGASVILYKEDGRHIRADGARHIHTIVYYKTAEEKPMVIGRPEGSKRRGKAVLQDDRVVVSSLEYWGSDGREVFEAFLKGEPLEKRFTLRDPSVPSTTAEIRRAIGARE